MSMIGMVGGMVLVGFEGRWLDGAGLCRCSVDSCEYY
jgi:hypothetical protein